MTCSFRPWFEIFKKFYIQGGPGVAKLRNVFWQKSSWDISDGSYGKVGLFAILSIAWTDLGL